MTQLTVAILTYKRPEELRRALPEMLRHLDALNGADSDVKAEILVIDNDPAGSAAEVSKSFGPGRLRYVVEPRPGISAGRNRGLDEAIHSDLLAYIDDDERPEELWLQPLLDTWTATGAAAVMGRVVSTFSTALDPWVEAGAFFVRRRMPTGTSIGVAAAGNLLLDMNQIRQLGVRFDDRLGLTGGEDTLFSSLLVRRGGRIVWCDESVASDFVPVTRATRGWVLKRSWSHGNSATLVDLHLATGRAQGAIMRVRAVCRGSIRIAAGAARFSGGILTRSLRHQARGLRTAFYGAGMLTGALGHVYEEYGRTAEGTSDNPAHTARGGSI